MDGFCLCTMKARNIPLRARAHFKEWIVWVLAHELMLGCNKLVSVLQDPFCVLWQQTNPANPLGTYVSVHHKG